MTRRTLAHSAATAAASALAFAAWIGWDRTYDLMPGTSSYTGPLQAWQVIGCAFSILAVIVVAIRARLQIPALVVSVTTAVTAAYSIWAATMTNDIGANMWPIGAALVAGGAAIGTAVAAKITQALLDRGRPLATA
jgi:hypothetical protein